MRLWIFREDFGQRLSASLGATEATCTANWFCAARLLLAFYCYLWIQLNTSALSVQSWRIQGLLNIYLFYSVLIFGVLRLHGIADFSYRVTTLAVDFFFAGTATLLTGGPESPYVVLLVFVVTTSAYGSGLRQTNFTAAACALLLVVEVIVFKEWPEYFGGNDSKSERLLLLGAFVVFISLLIGYMAVRERRLRAGSALLARVLGRDHPEPSIELALETLFAEIAPLYLPRMALIALRRTNTEEVFFWDTFRSLGSPPTGTIRTVLQFSKLEAATFSFPAHTWYLRRGPRRSYRAYHLLAFDEFGRKVSSLESEDLNAYLSGFNVPSLMVSSFSFGKAWSGRLILIAPRIHRDSKEALRFLQTLAYRISPLMRDMYLLRDIRMQAEDHVRSGLTRELHDGTLQSLLSMEMQLEVLKRQPMQLSGELERRLVALQNLVHQEALNLRDLIEKTKPLNFSQKELPNMLAELVARFRRDTGISARLETGKNIILTPSICHEIVRIVQEGLSNVRKHSRARNVVITLCEGLGGQYKLSIGDDGEGFGFRGRVTHTQLDESHRGPGIIKERVRLIGGELTIDSNPGHGTRLEITIPEGSHG